MLFKTITRNQFEAFGFISKCARTKLSVKTNRIEMEMQIKTGTNSSMKSTSVSIYSIDWMDIIKPNAENEKKSQNVLLKIETAFNLN